MLPEVLTLDSPADFKVHFARWNGDTQPLEAFVRSEKEWRGWQAYKSPHRNEFNRDYIFSLAQFYHEIDTWIFAGVYQIIDRLPDRYEVKLSDIGLNFSGRLKLYSPYRGRTTRANLENHYKTFEVKEVLRERYSGRRFPGYDEIDLAFAELETLVRNERADWRAPLEAAKGVYLITDTLTGKRYVGSAYGGEGIWSRWRAYVETGHGGNAELRTLIKDPTLEYCRANFRITLLENLTSRTADDLVIRRETFWKRVLLTRGEHGLNRN